MLHLFGVFRTFVIFDQINIDNFVFKLHYKFTAVILLIFSVIVTARQYIGDPIDCLVHGTKPSILDTYCWVTSTFTLPSEFGQDSIHPGVGSGNLNEPMQYHSYYKWVCFVLFIQAVFFITPHYLWTIFENGRIRFLANNLNFLFLDADKLNSECKILSDYFKCNLGHHNLYAIKYVVCEFLNFLNVIGQMFLIDSFLEGEFWSYGSKIIQLIGQDYKDRTDQIRKIFPTMTKCTYSNYGASGSKQIIDALCVLPINFVNEKIYVFLWFWLIILSVITFIGFIVTIAMLFSKKLRAYMLVLRFGKSNDILYVSKYLEFGDWFLFYKVILHADMNSGCVVIHEIVETLKTKWE